MCGIAGWFNRDSSFSRDEEVLRQMTGLLTHRGPDEDGYHFGHNIALGQRRLSIIDLTSGRQPIYDETGTTCVVFNGEIFNYIELREQLSKRGHRFRTNSDTEVIVHAYEEYGDDFVTHLNGQFAIALWSPDEKTLILARDRVGIRPLFYTLVDGTLVFASEMKALFAYPGVVPEIDIGGIEQILTLWVNVPPRTPFRGISELGPGCLLRFGPDGMSTRPYWRLSFAREDELEDRGLEYYGSRLQDLLHDAIALRLRADVPVASYLSGGIDSSVISSLVKRHYNDNLVTFSVAFSDEAYDERAYQMAMVEHIGTDHRMIEATPREIGRAFSDVVYFAEKPVIRTAPAPLFLLAGMVRRNGIKVVLTGEGADEQFGGYNIFKEDAIRRFWARQPGSALRPLLLSRIYPYINNQTGAFWQAFFRKGLEQTDDPYYSHRIRWRNTAQIARLLRSDVTAMFDPQRNIDEALERYIDPDIGRWPPLCRAQYLESTLFMSGYLLSSQGDRMMMGNSVEGRFPFLDHRLIEFAATRPPKYKVKGLNEKFILKHACARHVPPGIVHRSKQPYRAPISTCFLDDDPESRGQYLLSEPALRDLPYWDPQKVGGLMARLRRTPRDRIGARDDMAIAAIVSLQLLHDHFIHRHS